jgi:hypothetical protein
VKASNVDEPIRGGSDASPDPEPQSRDTDAPPSRADIEREWADAIRRGLRKGPMPADAEPKKPATKKGRRAD